MSEEDSDIPTVAEVEYIKDINGRIGVIGSIIPKISYEELVEKDELIRLSDHEQAMEEQREEVIEMLEEMERVDGRHSYRKGYNRALQDLKQKLKEGEDEAREDV